MNTCSLQGRRKGKTDNESIDSMNYQYAVRVYRNYGLEDMLTDKFFEGVKREFSSHEGHEP